MIIMLVWITPESVSFVHFECGRHFFRGNPLFYAMIKISIAILSVVTTAKRIQLDNMYLEPEPVKLQIDHD